MRCTDAREWMSAYVDGALAAGQREAFEEHLQGCRACADDLAALQRMVEGLRALAAPAAPALLAGVRARLEAAPMRTGRRSHASWLPATLPWHGLALASTAAVVLVIAGPLVRRRIADHTPRVSQRPALAELPASLKEGATLSASADTRSAAKEVPRRTSWQLAQLDSASDAEKDAGDDYAPSSVAQDEPSAQVAFARKVAEDQAVRREVAPAVSVNGQPQQAAADGALHRDALVQYEPSDADHADAKKMQPAPTAPPPAAPAQPPLVLATAPVEQPASPSSTEPMAGEPELRGRVLGSDERRSEAMLDALDQFRGLPGSPAADAPGAEPAGGAGGRALEVAPNEPTAAKPITHVPHQPGPLQVHWRVTDLAAAAARVIEWVTAQQGLAVATNEHHLSIRLPQSAIAEFLRQFATDPLDVAEPGATGPLWVTISLELIPPSP